MALRAILFDLDDTLIVDEAVSRETFEETGRRAEKLYQVDATPFARDAATIAKELWVEGPVIDYCRHIGISAFEGLWGDLGGDGVELEQLEKWTAIFAPTVFNRTLGRQTDKHEGAGADLAGFWKEERRRRMRLMPHSKEIVSDLAANYSLGLLTNGAPRFQRDKFERSGLGSHFKAAVISGDYGYGKPHKEIFDRLLEQLGGVASNEAVMVGNSLERDIQGAKNAGITSIWLHVPGAEEPHDILPDFEISSLKELPDILERL